MTTHVVTPETWNDTSFWQSLSVSNYDTLDLSQMGSSFSFSSHVGQNTLTLSDGNETFTVGGASKSGTDANLSQGHIHFFDSIVSPDAWSDDAVSYGGEVQDFDLGGGDDRAIVRGGDDTVDAGSGDDYVDAGKGDDSVIGGSGNDTLIGGKGNDILSSGEGQDKILAGDGADLIIHVGAGDTIDGGAGGDDHDTLDLSGSVSPGGTLKVIPSGTDSDGNGTDGMVKYFDADGALEGVLYYKNIESVLPCFLTGTLIRTDHGDRPVESLKCGDAVLTRDNGFQEIRWIGHRHLSSEELAANPKLRPIEISPSALGAHQPSLPLLVSPQHRVLVQGFGSDLLYGAKEVLVAAAHLMQWDGIARAQRHEVTYVHLLFPRHEIVLSNGAWTESFQPGDMTLAGMDDAQRAEIYALFPELRENGERTPFAAARPTLKRHEAAVLTAPSEPPNHMGV